jgi:uncharacterized membrane protein YphA (DoxX/SURF4 family)
MKTLDRAEILNGNTATSGISLAATLLLLRLFLAYEWLNAGISKVEAILTSPQGFFQSLGGMFAGWAEANPYPFMADFLTGALIPNVGTVVTLVTAAEVTIGVVMVVGFFVRGGAVLGIFLNVIFFLAAGTSHFPAGLIFAMIAAQVALFASSGGRFLGVDGLIRARLAPKLNGAISWLI